MAILREECRYYPTLPEEFEHAVATETDERDHLHVCHEFRFMGALGSGGKFRNNGNNGNVPYVDCYLENLNAERQAMIDRANERLRELFTPAHGPLPMRGE